MVLLLVLLSTIAALGLSEGVLAAWGPRPTYRAYWRASLPYFELDSLYLYRVQPRASGEFNSAGYRGPEFPPKSARKRLLALGDSFFMGLNVAEQETLPSTLGRALGDGFEVLNLGVYGYGPDQLLARYRAEGRALDADGVLLGIYAENDFNDLYKNRVFVYAEDGSLTPNAKNPVRNALPPTHLELFLRRAFTGPTSSPPESRSWRPCSSRTRATSWRWKSHP